MTPLETACAALLKLRDGDLAAAQALIGPDMPDHPDLLRAAIYTAFAASDYRRTLDLFERGDFTDDDLAQLLFIRSVAREGCGDLEGAERDIEAALVGNPSDPMLLDKQRVFRARRVQEGRGNDRVPFNWIYTRELLSLEASAIAALKAGRLREGFGFMDEMNDDRKRTRFREAMPGCPLPSDIGTIERLGRDPLPRWDGRRDKRLSLAVLGLDGLGDSIQWARFLHPARREVGHMTLILPPPLVPIMQADRVVSIDRTDAALAEVDAYATLTSIASQFASSYCAQYMGRLTRDPAKVKNFGPGFHVGICWAGNPNTPGDAYRSTTVEALAPLASVDGVTWHSLQVGARAHEAQLSPLPFVTHPIKDFGDTLAIVDALDLVVAVETSTAHLAGSAGARLWVPLTFKCEWRWGDDGDSTPWYPSAKLFRQPSPGDWKGVFERMARDLSGLVKLHNLGRIGMQDAIDGSGQGDKGVMLLG